MAQANLAALPKGRALGRVVALVPQDAKSVLSHALGRRLNAQSLLSTIVRLPTPSVPILRRWIVKALQSAAARQDAALIRGSAL